MYIKHIIIILYSVADTAIAYMSVSRLRVLRGILLFINIDVLFEVQSVWSIL